MFYDRFCALCKEKEKSPCKVADETGISRSAVSTWKNMGRVPKVDSMQKIADYFDVSVSYLLGETNNKQGGTVRIKLRELRNERKMTMKQLAEVIGCSESTISLYETEKREPDISTLLLLSDFFGVTTDYLIGRSTSSISKKDRIDQEDIAFYQEFMALDDRDKDILRDLVQIMRKRT